jgi:hypothetical protein
MLIVEIKICKLIPKILKMKIFPLTLKKILWNKIF